MAIKSLKSSNSDLSLHKKMKFSIKDFFSKCDQILNGKLHFLCSVFCLKLNSRQHVAAKEFKEVNWLSTKERVEQCVATIFLIIARGLHLSM